MLRVVAIILLLWLASACSSTPPAKSTAQRPGPISTGPPSAGPSMSAPSVPSTPSETPSAAPTPAPKPERGIDVSHHQGPIDWKAVSGARVEFAYLKATEGRTFTDPRFAQNSRDAGAAGLRVGAYHYFSLCSPGAEQGQHFADTIAAQTDAGVRPALPPAVDLELLGSCPDPPERAALLAEVRAFIDVVEGATGQGVVVYSFPDFEERYGFAEQIDRRQWVRRLGDQPPKRDWWLWQRSQSATIAGISGPVDLNVLQPRG